MPVANQDQGYSTANFTPTTSPSQTSPTLSTVSVDTGNAGGSAPATVSVPVYLLNQANAVPNPTATAFAGGGQASAKLLGYGYNVVNVVATAADSVKLPPAVAGAWAFIRNTTANAAQIFAGGTSTINGAATATGVSQGATSGALYFCITGDGTDVAGTWVRLLGATG